MNAIDLKGKSAAITGGARGIGYAIAERMLDSGARVCLWDLDESALQEAAAKLGEKGEVTTQQVELTKAEQVQAAAEGTVRAFGQIDILVNNAGIAGVSKKLWECTPEEWTQVIDIDLVAVFLCCRAVAPGMIEKGWGRIVNIASIAGKEGNPNASHYSAAKAGVIGLTKSLGKELAETGVIVNCITPAAVRTEIFDQMSQQHIDFMLSKIPMARFGQVEEIANLIAWLASQECSFSTGAVFDISGGRATY